MSSEIMALGHYAWSKHHRLAVAILSFASLALATTIVFALTYTGRFEDIAFCILFVGMVPSLFLCLAWMPYSNTPSLLDKRSAYDSRLLQLPLATWKLALVPTAMLTIHVATIWLLFVVAIRLLPGSPSTPYVLPMIAICMGAIFLTSLGWRPQRGNWRRLVMLLIAFPLLVWVFVLTLFIRTEAPEWLTGAYVVLPLGYVAANLHALKSVRLARVSAFQQVIFPPIDKRSAVLTPQRTQSLRPASTFRDAQAAIRWHDIAKNRSDRLIMLLGITPIFLMMLFSLPMKLGVVLIGLGVVGFLAFMATLTVGEPEGWNRSSTLPTYLLACPMRSKDIAWNRLWTVTIVFGRYVICAVSLWLLIFLWPANMRTALQWYVETSQSEMSYEPIRWAFVYFSAMSLIFMGFAHRTASLRMLGKQGVGLVVAAHVIVAIGAPMIAFLVWFIQQSDWDTVQTTLSSWARHVPSGSAVVLLFKIAIVAVFISAAIRRRQVSTEQTVTFILAWVMTVVALGVCFWLCLPIASVPFHWVLIGTALALPLTPLFSAPIFLDANRHRGN